MLEAERTCHGVQVRPGSEQDEPEGPLTTPVAPTPSGALRAGSSARAQALLALPALGFLLPFLGPLLSCLALRAAVPQAGAVAWGGGVRRPRLLALLGWLALWWPAVVFYVFLSVYGDQLGSPETDPGLQAASDRVDAVGVTIWLFVPLAAPQDWISPAAAALAVVALGAVVSARVHRPWPWLLALAAAPLAYALVVDVLQIGFDA